MKEYAILLDNTFCTGCNTCSYRCIQEYRYHDQASKGLFRTFVKINDEGLYQKRCMHCQEPTCVANCPVKALTSQVMGRSSMTHRRVSDARHAPRSVPSRFLNSTKLRRRS